MGDVMRVTVLWPVGPVGYGNQEAVLASDFDAALAREAELQELSARVRRDLIDSENREAALREELAEEKERSAHYGRAFNETSRRLNELQPRLTDAEQRNAVAMFSIRAAIASGFLGDEARKYLEKAYAALKPTESGAGE